MAFESKSETTFDKIDDLAIRTVRVLAADTVEKANSGHPGAPMGLAPVAHVLWSKYMNGNPLNPSWINRDRFVLSNGHACALQYCMLHLNGYNIKMDDLKEFRQLSSVTPGHPEVHLTDGIEVSSGPLGQGIAQAVGLAIASKHLASIFNKPNFELFNHKIYVICGDGCMQEGVSSEASSLAGHLKLNNLVIIYDDNNITIDGKTELSFTEKVGARYRAYGFRTYDVEDGNNDLNKISQAIESSQNCDAPVLISLSTIIGYGSSKANTHGVHGSPLGTQVLENFKKEMQFDPKKNFVVDDSVYKRYQDSFIARGKALEDEWNKLFSLYCEKYPSFGSLLSRLLSGKLPLNWKDSLPSYNENSKILATRNINGEILNIIADIIPEVIGGAADLTPSTKTQLVNSHDFQSSSYDGRYIRFGIREFGMMAIGNGISAYGCNLIPFTSTFLNFITYGWGAVRLGALSQLRHIYIMTHDSIFLGEDGPTHQPVEVLPLLRATPNLITFRPCDGNEINAAYIAGLELSPFCHGGTVICLSRQKIKPFKNTSVDNALNGAYIVLNESDKSEQKDSECNVIIISTGSEVHMCIDAANILSNVNNLKVRIVSAPCLEIFDSKNLDYRKSVIKENTLVVSVEASNSLGWSKYSHYHIAVNTFGSSAPLKSVQDYFGFTPEKIAKTVNGYVAKWNGKQAPLLSCLYP